MTMNMKTYSLRAPISTHYRRASCKEVECEHYQDGWTIPLSGCDDQMKRIIKNSGKQYTVQELNGGKYVVFAPGQECFKSLSGGHLKAVEREPFYLVGRGDWRQFIPRKAKVHANGDDWVDDFATHQDALKLILDRG